MNQIKNILMVTLVLSFASAHANCSKRDAWGYWSVVLAQEAQTAVCTLVFSSKANLSTSASSCAVYLVGSISPIQLGFQSGNIRVTKDCAVSGNLMDNFSNAFTFEGTVGRDGEQMLGIVKQGSDAAPFVALKIK